jgi:HPt (histidine-containing phosphotransfer) domain-containing protein
MPTSEEVPVARVASWLSKLIPRFMQNRRDEIAILREAIDRGDYARIRSLGHNLKGIGPSYGFEPLCALGLELERAAAAGDGSALSVATDALETYVTRVQVEFIS